MMYAVVKWCDGFGNDSWISGIYSTAEEAIKNANFKSSMYPDKVIAFNFGEVDFDYYSNVCITTKRKRNKKTRKKKNA